MFLRLSRGENLWYEQSEGELKLIFLGGLGMSTLGWRGVLGALSKPWGNLCLDFPGSGRSDDPSEELSISSLAEAVVELMDYLQVPQISPVGISMGGFVALEMGWRFPGRVEKLVLINTASRLEGRGREQLALWEDFRREGCPTELILRQQLLCTLSENFFSSPQRMEQSLALFRRYQDQLWQRDPGFFAQAQACRKFDLSEKVHEINIPALLLSGEEDFMIPPSSMRKLAEDLPQSIFRTCSGGGHALYVEQPSEIARCLEDFF